jgi:hypothetical protein
MIWLLIGLAFVFLIGLILYDAESLAIDEYLVKPLIVWLERRLWWLRIHVGLLIAIVAGASITAIGYLVESDYEPVTKWLVTIGDTELLTGIKNWAPHFGPELIVLAFAAIFVEGALRKREQLRALRFRTIQAFMYVLNYALQHQLYFDGGSSNFLEMEKDALMQRSNSRRRGLWFDERLIYDVIETRAVDFIDKGIKFAKTTDDIIQEGSLLRKERLLSGEYTLHAVDRPLWNRVSNIEAIAKAAARKVPLSTWLEDITISDLVDKASQREWENEKAGALSLVNEDGERRLNEYFGRCWAAIELRVELLNRFYFFQAAVLSLRNRIWASDNPDE